MENIIGLLLTVLGTTMLLPFMSIFLAIPLALLLSLGAVAIVVLLAEFMSY